ncbi:radical SAM protein [Bdellovibrionota bacterium FG-2]
MRYLEPVFRPPSEADSLILQITYGCTHNKCTFCAMYREKKFKVRPVEEVLEDIQEASRRYPDTRRVFLADGDAMVLKTSKLLQILEKLELAFPALERVGIYADSRGILQKTGDELQALREHKLAMVYLGLESGSNEVLRKLDKGATASEMTLAIQRAKQAGIQTSVIALLGAGGRALSSLHAQETARVVSEMSPDFFSALTLTLVPGTPLAAEVERGEFEPLSPQELLAELGQILAQISPTSSIVFRTNHASNYVPLRGCLPDDKEEILSTLQWAIENHALRPEWMRGL